MHFVIATHLKKPDLFGEIFINLLNSRYGVARRGGLSSLARNGDIRSKLMYIKHNEY